MKTITLLTLCILISACSPFGFNPMGYEVKHENLDEAWKKVASMKYTPESQTDDYWKSPAEFFQDGGGDCEDFAIALVYLLGEDAKMVTIRVTSATVHAIVRYKNIWIEPQNYTVYYDNIPPLSIVGYYPYKILMLYATYGGSKNSN